MTTYPPISCLFFNVKSFILRHRQTPSHGRLVEVFSIGLDVAVDLQGGEICHFLKPKTRIAVYHLL